MDLVGSHPKSRRGIWLLIKALEKNSSTLKHLFEPSAIPTS
jgi:hypothetical protein